MNSEPEGTKRLLNKLEKLPQVHLSGVVYHPHGARTMPVGRGLKYLEVSLGAWRIDDGPIVISNLQATKRAPAIEAERLRASLAGRYRTISMLAKVLTDTEFWPRRQALMIELLGIDDDPSFDLAKTTLVTPVRQADPILGVMELDRFVGVWNAELQWRGSAVGVSFASDPDDVLGLPRNVCQQIDWWHDLAVTKATSDLLGDLNLIWRKEEGLPPLSSEQFSSALVLCSLSFSSDKCTATFEAGELFWGHVVRIRLDLRQRLAEDAYLEG